MAHSIELLLDKHGDAAVRRLWQRLADFGLPSQSRVESATNRPHITLVAAQRITPDVDSTLEQLAEDFPLPVVVGAPLIFGGGDRLTLARLAVGSAGLLALHDEVYTVARPSMTGLFDHSRPGHWTPHVTLGRRFTPDQVGRALAQVDEIAADIATTVVGVRRWDGDARTERLLFS